MKLHSLKMLAFVSIQFALTAKISQAQEKSSPLVGFQVGTMGLGFQYVHPINSRWDLRAAATYFQLKHNREWTTTTTSTLTTSETIKGRTGGVSLIADYNLSSKTPNFKLAFGALYQLNRLIDTRSYLVEYSGQNVDLGNLTLEYTTFPVSPYAGFVWGNFKTEKKIVYSIELGTLYHGKPRVDFTGEGRIAPTAEQDEMAAENVKDYNWYPVLNFQINYKLK